MKGKGIDYQRERDEQHKTPLELKSKRSEQHNWEEEEYADRFWISSYYKGNISSNYYTTLIKFQLQ